VGSYQLGTYCIGQGKIVSTFSYSSGEKITLNQACSAELNSAAISFKLVKPATFFDVQIAPSGQTDSQVGYEILLNK